MRVCIIYDCLFPWTIGGAERWYRSLAERLAAEGHEVTYLTLRQWDGHPDIAGVHVVAVGPRMKLYRDSKRRMLPPIVFGLGVLAHLIRHGGRYDVLHTCSFPYFSLLAAGAARWRWSFRINCDWYEVWSDNYWRDYLGPMGRIGAWVQRLCAKVPQQAFSYSDMHERRMRALGLANIKRLTGIYDPAENGRTPVPAEQPPTVVYAGRFIPEKRLHLLVDAMVEVRSRRGDVRAKLIGDGPVRPEILAQIEARGLSGFVSCPGFVSPEELDRSLSTAACLAQPSSREGYGLVVVEAAHRGVPVVVVAAPDNAATELVEEGCNGFVVLKDNHEALADGIIGCIQAGQPLRESTAKWFGANEARLSLETSLAAVVADFERGPSPVRQAA